jgi:hypothetical protein
LRYPDSNGGPYFSKMQYDVTFPTAQVPHAVSSFQGFLLKFCSTSHLPRAYYDLPRRKQYDQKLETVVLLVTTRPTQAKVPSGELEGDRSVNLLCLKKY